MNIIGSEMVETLDKRQLKEYSQSKTLNIVQRFIKRMFDILFGILGVILLIPLTICIYIAIKISHQDDGPLFYKQLRIGKDGKTFRLYKFRTMVVGADKILYEYLEENEEARKEYEINKKLKNDPRITKIGKILRKTSLDEIPQFINILKGDMSLIGPRPYLLREQEDMEEYYYDIVKVKPGITGLWQVSGIEHSTFEERLKLEKYYANNWSIKEDIKIFFKTFKAITGGHGAGI